MMDISSQWQSSTTATYRFPLWWPPEMVVVPTVPKEDRAEVLRKATSRLSAKVTAYPACRPGLVVGHR